MSLYNRPLEDILKAIKALNGTDLVENQYTYGPPVAVEADGAGTNTSMTITALNPISPYDGSTTVRYTRLDLAGLETLVPLTIRVPSINNTFEVAQALNKRYGTNFTTDDIVSTPVVLEDGNGTATLVAKPESRGWIGEVEVTITPGGRPIADYVTVTNLGGLPYPSIVPDKPYAAMYSYWRNFTAQHVQLEGVEEGTGNLDVVLAVLIANTGDTWKATGVSRYSLAGATVSYSGPTSGHPKANTDYDSVVVVDLVDANSLGLTGSLFLHHND